MSRRGGRVSMGLLLAGAGLLVAAAAVVVTIALSRGGDGPPVSPPDGGGHAASTGPESRPQSNRIISLSPALTDMLFQMGVGDQVIGISRFATRDYGRPIVGDTVTLNVESILQLKPTHILIQQAITGKLELLRDEFGIEVLDCRTLNLATIKSTLLRLGELTHTDAGRQIAERIDRELDSIRSRLAGQPRPRVLLATSIDRIRTARRDTFVSELLEIAGGENVITESPVPYPTLNKEQVLELAPDIIIDVASELTGQDYNSPEMVNRRSYWQTLTGCPAVETGRVYVVQDAGITIPSAQVAESARKLAELIHPQIFRRQAQPMGTP